MGINYYNRDEAMDMVRDAYRDISGKRPSVSKSCIVRFRSDSYDCMFDMENKRTMEIGLGFLSGGEPVSDSDILWFVHLTAHEIGHAAHYYDIFSKDSVSGDELDMARMALLALEYPAYYESAYSAMPNEIDAEVFAIKSTEEWCRSLFSEADSNRCLGDVAYRVSRSPIYWHGERRGITLDEVVSNLESDRTLYKSLPYRSVLSEYEVSSNIDERIDPSWRNPMLFMEECGPWKRNYAACDDVLLRAAVAMNGEWVGSFPCLSGHISELSKAGPPTAADFYEACGLSRSLADVAASMGSVSDVMQLAGIPDYQ